MNTKILDLLTTTGASASVISIIDNVSVILTAIASLVAIITGCLSIYLKIKNAVADGKITDEEKADIKKEIEEVSDTAKKIKGE